LQELVARTRLALSTGGMAHATQFFPASGDPWFEQLNTERVQQLIAAKQMFAAEIGRVQQGRILDVKAYHHGLFTTVRLSDASGLAQGRRLARARAPSP